MAEPKKKPVSDKGDPKKDSDSTREELIKARRSQELIIGVCGAIGAGTRDLGKVLDVVLKKHGYSIETIKITDVILDKKHELSDFSLNSLSGFERYDAYQEAGNKIRKEAGSDKLAAEAIIRIISDREKHLPNKPEKGSEAKIDSLKNIKKSHI